MGEGIGNTPPNSIRRASALSAVEAQLLMDLDELR